MILVILLGEARGPIFVYLADTLAHGRPGPGAAPFGEDLTVVVVGGGERQPVCRMRFRLRYFGAFPFPVGGFGRGPGRDLFTALLL